MSSRVLSWLLSLVQTCCTSPCHNSRKVKQQLQSGSLDLSTLPALRRVHMSVIYAVVQWSSCLTAGQGSLETCPSCREVALIGLLSFESATKAAIHV